MLAVRDERRLDRAQADLEGVLYELNREVRLQYQDEEDEGFFESIRKTFTGDGEDDLPYTPRRTTTYPDDYRQDDYRTPRYEPPRYDEPRQTRTTRYDDYDEYDEWESSKSAKPPSRRPTSESRDYPPPTSERYYGREKSRRIPAENNWDEEDDDWF